MDQSSEHSDGVPELGVGGHVGKIVGWGKSVGGKQ